MGADHPQFADPLCPIASLYLLGNGFFDCKIHDCPVAMVSLFKLSAVRIIIRTGNAADFAVAVMANLFVGESHGLVTAF